MKETTRRISAIVDYRINFFALEPVLKDLINLGVLLDLYCADALVPIIKASLPGDRFSIISLDEIRSRTALWFRLQRVLRLLVADPNFSTTSAYQHQRERNSSNLAKRILHRGVERFPKMKNTNVNRFLANALGRIVPNVFQTESVIAPSRTLVPELLCAKGLKVSVILESWDHPGKFPTGFVAHNVFVWNSELGNDWIEFQGDPRFTIGYPTKHRYVIEDAKRRGNPPLKKLREGATIMYAVTTPTRASNQVLYREELQYMEDLCEVTKKHGYRLLIKPKPQGNTRDFDFLEQKYSNVSVGSYKESGERPEDYYLDSSYNQQRLNELERCDFMINGGTTFGIDAAIFGLPILQLDFRESSRYPTTAKAFRSYHLQRYFLSDSSLTLQVRNDQSVFESVNDYLNSPDGRENHLSTRLKTWLYTDEPFENAMRRMARTIIHD